MMKRVDVEDAVTLGVLGVLGLLNYAWWGVRILAGYGLPEYARGRSS